MNTDTIILIDTTDGTHCLDEQLINNILIKKPYSITKNKFDIKKDISPNDYASNATYYWPDEKKINGLPYIRKDSLNPDKYILSDRKYIDQIIDDLLLLTVWYLYTKNTKYSKKIVDFIRVFFIDSATRMNPNLDYSGYIKYSDSGLAYKKVRLRGNIIDTNKFFILPDIMVILKDYFLESNFFDKKIPIQMQLWFRNMASWFMYSEYGLKQKEKNNNILSSYYLQLICYLYGSGDTELSKDILQTNIYKILSTQIDEHGNQINEITREYPIHYCNFNLDIITKLMIVSQNLGIDISNYEDKSGRGSILKAMIKAAELINNTNILSEINNNQYAISWINIASNIYKENLFISLKNKHHNNLLDSMIKY
jgi:hypothetical protein